VRVKFRERCGRDRKKRKIQRTKRGKVRGFSMGREKKYRAEAAARDTCRGEKTHRKEEKEQCWR